MHAGSFTASPHASLRRLTDRLQPPQLRQLLLTAFHMPARHPCCLPCQTRTSADMCPLPRHQSPLTDCPPMPQPGSRAVTDNACVGFVDYPARQRMGWFDTPTTAHPVPTAEDVATTAGAASPARQLSPRTPQGPTAAGGRTTRIAECFPRPLGRVVVRHNQARVAPAPDDRVMVAVLPGRSCSPSQTAFLSALLRPRPLLPSSLAVGPAAQSTGEGRPADRSGCVLATECVHRQTVTPTSTRACCALQHMRTTPTLRASSSVLSWSKALNRDHRLHDRRRGSRPHPGAQRHTYHTRPLRTGPTVRPPAAQQHDRTGRSDCVGADARDASSHVDAQHATQRCATGRLSRSPWPSKWKGLLCAAAALALAGARAGQNEDAPALSSLSSTVRPTGT
jgi:hypothetical protein